MEKSADTADTADTMPSKKAAKKAARKAQHLATATMSPEEAAEASRATPDHGIETTARFSCLGE